MSDELGSEIGVGVEAPGTGFSASVDSASVGSFTSKAVNFTAKEEQLLRDANTHESSFNAPMLITWIYKNVDEEPTLITGIAY